MTDTILPLADGFPAKTAEDWRPLAEKALRGADFDTTLGRQTDDGIARGPAFFERPAGAGAVDTAPRDLHLPWGMRQTLLESTPDKANSAALDDLMGGVSELELRLDPDGQFGLKANELDALDAALQGVDLSLAPIHLDCVAGQGHHAHLALTLFARRRIDGETLTGGLGLSPIERAARQGIALDDNCFPKAGEIVQLAAAAFPNLKIFRADGAFIHESGGTSCTELSVMAGAAVSYVRLMIKAGLSPDQAVSSLEARLAADVDIHLTIAKLRAARRILNRIAEAFGAEARIAIQAVSSGRMMSAKDPWTNLIRVACAGFAAAAGGADAITLRPLTDAIGRPTAMGRRVARNLHILLAEESHIGKVTDPAAGSYLHENLADRLARDAWENLQDFEREGGVAKWFASGDLQADIEMERRAKITSIAQGDEIILGVTKYPDPDPKAVETDGVWPDEPWPESALAPIRLATQFEGAAQ